MITNFQQLTVWQKAHELVLKVYMLTGKFPNEERYGLISQMRRASVSVPANIAEGFKKRSRKDKVNFYNIAEGSLEELRYYFILSNDLHYCQKSELLEGLAADVSRLLSRLIESINQHIKQNNKN
jgi:four helix bundle protein